MRPHQWRSFQAHDGQEIVYRHWPQGHDPGGTPGKAILLLHRGHEHSGRVAHLVDELNLPGYAFFAWDARGHGRTPGPRGAAEHMGVLVKDLDSFARHIEAEHGIPIRHMAVIGQSIGAVVAACWAHDYAPPLRALVLAAPAFRVKLYVPFARPALAWWTSLRGDVNVRSYVTPEALTRDAQRIQDYKSDVLICRNISARLLLDLFRAARRVVQDAAAIQTPTQLLLSGDDRVVGLAEQRRFFANLGCPHKEMHALPGFLHDTLGERDRALPVAHARSFLLRRFEDRRPAPDLRRADIRGHTRDEYLRLLRPLPFWSLRRWGYAATRLLLRVGGRLSEGMRIGLREGFDSGASLDYVYRNRPTGAGPLGRLLDRAYLGALGWRGVRVRKEHLEATLAQTIAQLRRDRQPVRILDIAAGHGRYVLDTLSATGDAADEVILRDFCPNNAAAGARMIAARGMAAFARFETADALDRNAFHGLQDRCTIAIASGLYELIPRNQPVRESLAGIANAVTAGGYLIYTGQPWHPQLETIARTLVNHRDRGAWVMRRRTQAELDQLVESAGFHKIGQFTDQWGIFTVSLARRIAPSAAPAAEEELCAAAR